MKSGRVLITGISGFVGSHLAEYLLANGSEVYGTIRWRSKLDNIEHIKDKLKLIEGDIRDSYSMQKAIAESEPDFVFSLAAQSFVPASWRSPSETISTNVEGTLNVLEACRNGKTDPRIVVVGCYSSDTRAVTPEGFKTFEELKEGDLVISIDPETREVSYKKIKKVITQKYDGPMVNFKSRSVDLLVTPNHRMLIEDEIGKGLQYEYANDVYGVKYLPLGKSKGEKTIFSKELFYLLGIFIGDGYEVQAKRKHLTSGLSNQEQMKYRNEKGQFIKTGKKQYLKEYPFDRVFLAIPKEDKARRKVEETLSKLGIKYSGYDIEIYFKPSEKLLEILKECGKGAHNKVIPNWALQADQESLQELFLGLVDSDGHHKRNNNMGYTTVSTKLVPQIIELCHKLGKWVTFSKRDREAYFDGRVIRSTCFDFSITEGAKTLTKSGRSVVPYSGDIWCVEVEKNHNLLVERNKRVCFCGNSSEEYGMVLSDEIPIKETNPLRPLSPYGVSKVATDMLGYQYHQSYGMKIVRTRSFNTTGPRRGEPFATSNFAKQIAEIEKGLRKPVMYVGNLEAKRDFTDVRDVVDAYWKAANHGEFGEVYNICSEVAWRIGYVLHELLSMSKADTIKVECDPDRMRPSDVQILLCDCAKFRERTGWKPAIPFKQTLSDLLDYWRRLV